MCSSSIDAAGIVTHRAYPPAEEPSDPVIVEAVLSGKRELYALLVARYQEGLFRYALGMVGDGDIAHDMVQDAFVAGYERLGRCRNPAGFRSWLFSILRNRCLDHLKEYRRRNVSLDSELTVSDGTTPQDDLQRSLDGREIASALRALPELLREAFLLKHVQDLSYQEMAEMLDASESALKMRVKRAREQLAEALGPRPPM